MHDSDLIAAINLVAQVKARNFAGIEAMKACGARGYQKSATASYWRLLPYCR
jgi:hypothetical protein